jgi:multiple sugar transport system substrate-binding protein
MDISEPSQNQKPNFPPGGSSQENIGDKAPFPIVSPPNDNDIMGKIIIVVILGVISLGILGIIKIVPRLPLFKTSPQSSAITFWGLEDENVIKPLIDEYQKTHPKTTIIYQKQNLKLYQERLESSLEKEGGPDIFRFHNTWLPILRNYLAPVPSTVFTTEEYEKTFYPVTKNDLKQGSRYYGIPLEIDCLVLLYNEDIFNSARLEPPSTWEDLRNTAMKLTVKDVSGQIRKAGVALGTTNNIDFWSDIIGLMLLQNGTDVTKIDSTILSDGSNAGEDTINYFVNFAKGENRVWDETLDNSTLAFAAERLAMYFGTLRGVHEVKRLNPALKFKVIPVPQLANQQTNWANYWVEGVSIKSPVTSEGWDFLKFLSSKESLKELFTNASKQRIYGEAYPRIDMAQDLKENEFLGAVISQAPTAISWYLADKTEEGDKGLNSHMRKNIGDAVSEVLQGKPTKEALGKAEKEIQKVLATYGLIAPLPTPSGG